jgi:CBS domain containing-hemolysin-like protein
LLRSSIEPLGAGRWSVTGMTSLRRLGRTLDRELPPVKGVTVAGMLQEMLQRLPQTGDEVVWAGLQFRVIGSMDQGPMTIEVTDKGDPRP